MPGYSKLRDGTIIWADTGKPIRPFGEPTMKTEDQIKAKGEDIMTAARTLIGMTRKAERNERGRATKAELELQIELTGGGVETWLVTVERTASSH